MLDRPNISELTDLPPVADYLARIEAKPRSLRTAVVYEPDTEKDGYRSDRAVIRFGKDGTVTAPEGYEPTDVEAAAIKAAWPTVKWPTSERLSSGWALPPEIQEVDREKLFEVFDRQGKLVMIQERAERAGGKDYIPWSYWSDGRWRRMEPEGDLPLYGLDQIGANTTVFIHEGAKAARAVQRLINPRTAEEKAALANHPWGRELQGAAHLGWIGGANAPHRSDWGELAKAGIVRAYIVADNDRPGLAAVPSISRQINVPTFAVQFTDEWPSGFDLADPFPKKMFSHDGRYIGPSFHAMLEPATWATDLKPVGGGKPVTVLRKHFSHQWVYANEPELFINVEDPRIVRAAENLSRRLVKFSHSTGTARLLLKECDQVVKPAYAPDRKTGIITLRDERVINVFRPSGIRPKPGDAGPWTEFLAYLFPIAAERKTVERWSATLVAKPEIRMHFGLLLASETQGVGKGIFATQVLAPLVGHHNVGFPSEHDIVDSAFNDWMAQKRLVVVGEIYQGQSFKAYNKLKGVISDPDFDVNKKHQASYRIDNWCHVVACSNTYKALKVEKSDRRWFYPQVTEERWPREKFAEFVAWLNSGGQVIAQWAADYGEYISTGEHPPMTDRKSELIEESQAEELRWVRDYCAGRIADGESFIISTDVAFDRAKRTIGRIYSSKLDLGKQMLAAGMVQLKGDENRVQHESKRHNLFLSPQAAIDLAAAEANGFSSMAEESLKARRNKWLRDRLSATQKDLQEGDVM